MNCALSRKDSVECTKSQNCIYLYIALDKGQYLLIICDYFG